ncbi:MAG: metallophosphoesterase [Ignavibacteria bacterium]
MQKIILAVLIIFTCKISAAQESVKFAVIGDYGNAGPDEEAVADLVKSLTPDFVITTGDNNYDVGSVFTIDENIGQYYHEFIYPYTGTYGAGDTVNRFFPSLGNHDWGTPGAVPYLNYFQLPGNERYYEFVKGPVHFFVIDSDTNEYDGIDSNSIQAQWLKNALAQSSSRFNVVYLHHPPYCSGLIQGSEEIMRWPYKKWGASVVMAGHEHLYERLNVGGLPYYVNGLGGNLRSYFGIPISGSQVRYRANYGAMLVNAYYDSLVIKFININNSLIDNFKIIPEKKSLSLKIFIEARYDPDNNVMSGDTAMVIIRNNVTPYALIDSSKSFLSSIGTGVFEFSKADNASDYFLILKHRNSIETWSKNTIRFNINYLTYNFTVSDTSAFGNNLKLTDVTPLTFSVFSGDVNQDGTVDLADGSLIDNDIFNFVTGYVVSDLNGDGTVDIADAVFADNNGYEFVNVVTP